MRPLLFYLFFVVLVVQFCYYQLSTGICQTFHTQQKFFNVTPSHVADLHSVRHSESQKDIISTKNGTKSQGASAFVGRNFLQHIPKTGGASGKAIASQLLNELFGKTEKESRICLLKKEFLSDPRKWKKNLKRCLLFSGEVKYPESVKSPKHAFTMIRLPREHVLSQYFHCKESVHAKAKGRTERMPSLTKWLEDWVKFKEAGQKGVSPREKYLCYNPINLQNAYIHYPQGIDRFEVVGLTAHAETSTCLVVIALTGRVPSSCDCTHQGNANMKAQTPNTGRRQLSATTDDLLAHNDHGVVHHGGSYNATPYQLNLINMLTDVDQKLYEEATLRFDRQVKELEEKYGITLC